VAGASTSDGAAVIQYHTTGDANQRWTVQGTRLVSVNSGKCLDGSGGLVTQRSCDGSAGQTWTINDGTIQGLAVSGNSQWDGAQLVRGSGQRWILNATG